MADKVVNNKNNIKKNIINLITLAVFVLVILVTDIILIFNHDKSFSAKENRVLQRAPQFSLSGVTSGKYMSQVEDFVADQFPMRDAWISYKLGADKILGKKEAGNIYLANDGSLIEKAAAFDKKNYNKNTAAITQFCTDKNQNIVMAVIPNAISVCSSKLPFGAPAVNQNEMLEDISSKLSGCLTFVNVYDVLCSHNTEYIYYNSDHHWTSLGAKYAFEVIAKSLGINETVSNYEVYSVTDDFSGTLSSGSGAGNVKDVIDIYIPEGDYKYVVEYVNENEKSATIYSSQALETNSKYEVFLKGNHPLVKISTTADNQKNLMVIKDSYANAFIQFLLPYYEHIVIVDPRYYSDDIEKLINDNLITDILFLYNLNTFAADNSLAGILDTTV